MSDLNPAVLDIFSPPNAVLWPDGWLVPVPETRPSRLLGPAVPEATIRTRGVCPGCGLPYEACRLRTGLLGLRAPGGKNV